MSQSPSPSQSVAQQYDAVPFPGLPVLRAQPEYLEIMARWRGLHPAAAAEARVLELGCATGQNLLSLAERYPQATFLGLDISANQIAQAQDAARTLSLGNVEFRQQDILEIDASLGSFDYIIAHGVYSWVEADVRDTLLQVCREHLAPQGVAYVSYKTYPGWQLHDMLRSMMHYEGRSANTLFERVSRARMLLDFLKSSLTEKDPYDTLAQTELERVMKQSDAYLLHDHLADISYPLYYQQFIEHAQRHTLQQIGEGALGMRWFDFLSPQVEQKLAALTRDPVEQEQFRDILCNRTLRQTLLCHDNLALSPTLSSEVLAGMYLEGNLKSENTAINFKSAATDEFASPNGLRVSTPLPLAKAALEKLGSVWPDYIRFEDLIDASCARLEQAGVPAPISADERRRLGDNLLQCALAQAIQVHSNAPSFATTLSERPVASPIARWQSQRGEVVGNRRHEAVQLDPFERSLLNLLDGTRAATELVDQMVSLVSSGQLVVSEHGKPVTDIEIAKRVFGTAVPETLNRLTAMGLLVG